MKHFLGSIKLFGRHKLLWPYLWKPILIAFTLYVSITVAAALAVGGALGAQLQSSVMQPLGSAAGAALIVVTSVFLAGPLLAGLSTIVSSWHWEGLGKKVEELEGVDQSNTPLSQGELSVDIGLRVIFSLFAIFLILFFTLVGLWWAAALAAGFMSLADYTAGASQRRRIKFPGSVFLALRNKGGLALWLICSASSLFPLVFVLLHPVLAGAGTLLVISKDTTSKGSLDRS